MAKEVLGSIYQMVIDQKFKMQQCGLKNNNNYFI